METDNHTATDTQQASEDSSSTMSVRTNLYVCPYDYYEEFDPIACFSPANKPDPANDINIHGWSVDENHDWLDLFVVFDPCLNCKIPKYIELETATYSNTACAIRVSTDPNEIGKYNQAVYAQRLEVQDTVKIPIESYATRGIRSFKIAPNPAGCDLRIKSVTIN